MKTIFIILSSFFAFTRAATLVPIDSSSVSVQNSGKDYSYTVHQRIAGIPENRAFQVQPFAVTYPGLVGGVSPLSVTDLFKGKTAASKSVEANSVNQVQVHDKLQQPDVSQVVHSKVSIAAKSTIPLLQQDLTYTVPINHISSYNYMPASYALTYPYGLHYPYHIMPVQTII